MNNELHMKDVNENKTPSLENFRNIKPEKGMKPAEARSYTESMQKSLSETGKDSKLYDDNGKKFRTEERLNPNETFIKNEYKYKTDDQGRIKSTEGELKLKDPDQKSETRENVKNYEGQDYRANDDRGHLIGDRFGGSGGLENLVPMDANLNKGDYKKMENTLADALKDGAKVFFKVEPIYNSESSRPSEFKVSYSIDGEKSTRFFKNESRDQT